MLILKLLTILQILKASTLYIIRLYFIKLQYITLLWIVKVLSASIDLLISINTKLSCELRSLLLVKELFIKTINLALIRLIGIQRRLQLGFSIYYLRRLLSTLISLSNSYCAYIAIDKLKDASSQHVKVMYALQARCSVYYYA